MVETSVAIPLTPTKFSYQEGGSAVFTQLKSFQINPLANWIHAVSGGWLRTMHSLLFYKMWYYSESFRRDEEEGWGVSPLWGAQGSMGRFEHLYSKVPRRCKGKNGGNEGTGRKSALAEDPSARMLRWGPERWLDPPVICSLWLGPSREPMCRHRTRLTWMSFTKSLWPSSYNWQVWVSRRTRRRWVGCVFTRNSVYYHDAPSTIRWLWFSFLFFLKRKKKARGHTSDFFLLDLMGVAKRPENHFVSMSSPHRSIPTHPLG